MNPTDMKAGSVEGDLELVSKITVGDPDAWEEFVTRFTGWVVYRSHKWCKVHCRYRSQDVQCGLVTVYRWLGGSGSFSHREECDEGMDTYIWLLEQLRKRITRYRAKNRSRLSTFVWRVLNSKELYVDWLRWKYGRVF